MASLESSTEELTVQELRRLLRNLRESLGILAEWTNGLAEMVYEAAHIQLNNVLFTQELAELRYRAELLKQIQALPGAPPTVAL